MILTYLGDPSSEEKQRAVDEATAHPGFRPGSTLVFDTRSAYLTMPTDELRRRVDWAVGLVGRGFRPRYAVVAPAGGEGLANRGSELAAGRVEIGTFHTVEQALQWLRKEDRAP